MSFESRLSRSDQARAKTIKTDCRAKNENTKTQVAHVRRAEPRLHVAGCSSSLLTLNPNAATGEHAPGPHTQAPSIVS